MKYAALADGLADPRRRRGSLVLIASSLRQGRDPGDEDAGLLRHLVEGLVAGVELSPRELKRVEEVLGLMTRRTAEATKADASLASKVGSPR